MGANGALSTVNVSASVSAMDGLKLATYNSDMSDEHAGRIFTTRTATEKAIRNSS